MHLLYLYLDFTRNGERPEGCRGHRQCELNFGREEVYAMERRRAGEPPCRLRCIKRTEEARIEPGFWGDERICNISAIVGENGTGKTTLLHAILQVWAALYQRIPQSRLPFDFVCLVQDTEGERYLVDSRRGVETEASHFRCSIISYSDSDGSGPLPPLRKTKLLYFSNTISMAELEQYQRIYASAQDVYTDFICDCSQLAGMMRAQEVSSIGSKERRLEDQLYTYFTFESYQEARYLFDRNQRRILLQMREQGYPVPFPRELRLDIQSAAGHLKRVLKIHDGQYLEWGHRYAQFREHCRNKDRIASELSLNCVASFVNLVRQHLGDEAAAKGMLPQTFDRPSSYIQSMDSVRPAGHHRALEEAYGHCRKYIEFLWNNRALICEYWKDQGGGRYRIPLGEHLDPVLQELMIRFIDLNRAISQDDYFVTYSWGLSSGESILLRIFTKLRYLLDGAPYDEECTDLITEETAQRAALARREETVINHTRDGKAWDCDSVILLLDEADLSLHPEWQRVFVGTLAEYLPRLYPNPYCARTESGCRDIQLVMTTHSPLMLGDFPAAAVLYLKKDRDGFVTVETNSALQPFGQNLYTLLKDGFYLQNGTIGALAQKKIRRLLADAQAARALELPDQMDPAGVRRELDRWARRLEAHRRQTVRYLPKGILRGKLEETLALGLAAIDRKRDPERREQRKRELSREIARLERQLYELNREGEGSP